MLLILYLPTCSSAVINGVTKWLRVTIGDVLFLIVFTVIQGVGIILNVSLKYIWIAYLSY